MANYKNMDVASCAGAAVGKTGVASCAEAAVGKTGIAAMDVASTAAVGKTGIAAAGDGVGRVAALQPPAGP